MSRLVPVSWNTLARRFRELGFEGPYAGGRHPQMRRGDVTVIIPNSHEGDIRVGFLGDLGVRPVSRISWSPNYRTVEPPNRPWSAFRSRNEPSDHRTLELPNALSVMSNFRTALFPNRRTTLIPHSSLGNLGESRICDPAKAQRRQETLA
jgi:predicted RNA binding protein YcfA (HicA-like mRNA interferase family)